MALGEMGAEAKAAVVDLTAVLKEDRDETVRRYTAEVLGRIGPAAKGAVPNLIAVLKEKAADATGDAREGAALALGGSVRMRARHCRR